MILNCAQDNKDSLRTHWLGLKQVFAAAPLLNDIIKNINKAMGLQIMIFSLEYLFLGIFAIFGLVSGSFGNLYTDWYIFFTLLSHGILIIISVTNFMIQESVIYSILRPETETHSELSSRFII